MSTYTGMQFTIRETGFGDSIHVRCNSADGCIAITQPDSDGNHNVQIMYEEAKHLVRVLQHCIAMHGEP